MGPPLLFGLGIVLAISSSARLPADGQTWPDTLPLFCLGAALALVGLILWHRAVALHRRAPPSATAAADGTDPFSRLQNLLPPARQLAAELPGLSASQLCARVDHLLGAFLLPFVEDRQQVIDRLGMAPAAEILVTVAYGERLLNRAWSAASDGHLPEAHAAYPDALRALEHAAHLARQATASASGPASP